MKIEKIKEAAIPILKQHGVLKASLFGSWVRGDQKTKSDIDMLVEFEDGKSLFDLIGLEIDLEETLKRKVDVLTYDSIHPRLRDYVLSEQEVFYEARSESVS
jgi:hypothetical protein